MRHPAVLTAALLGLNACAGKLVRPASIALCRQGRCETVSDDESRQRLLTAVHQLLREAKGREIALYSAHAGDRSEKKRGVSFFVQGGPIPGRSTISGLRVADVLFIDRERSETKALAKTVATYVGVPLLCTESSTVVTVTPEEARLSLSNICTWVGIGTTATRFELLIDRVNVDEGTASGNWSARTAGLPVIGGGGGYMLARFREPPAPPPAPKPAPPVVAAAPPPAPKVEVLSESLDLALTAGLRDADGDRILNGDEEVTLALKVENRGKAPADRVRIVLSGESALVACLGQGRDFGAVAPAASVSAEVKCRLPAQVPAQTAALKVELLAGNGAAPYGAKIFRAAMKPASVPVVEEVVSELSVDDIPSRSGSPAPANVALVIGLSRYREKAVPAVKYGARDAEVVARYLENVAGVDSRNLKLLTDETATKSDLEAYFEDWLPRRVGPDSTVFVYYSGHGMPDAAGREAFLVPYEGQPDFPSKLYPLQRVYDALAKLPAKAVVVLLDSCFSGAKGRGLAREGARPLITSSVGAGPGGRVVVLSSASGSQIASDLDSVEHGLFTYYLLKGLRGEADADRDGSVTLSELFAFARENVSKRASVELNRDQTPVISGDPAFYAKVPIARR